MNAVVNPNGVTTTYHFDFGATDGYGNRLPVLEDVVAVQIPSPSPSSRR